MLKVETYADPMLQSLWEGYVQTEHWTVFFPKDGGKPLVFPNAMVVDEVLVEDTVADISDSTVWLTNDSST